MKKFVILILFCATSHFSDQIATDKNGVQVILRDDGSWGLGELPLDAEFQISPLVITEDSQLVLLKEAQWEYISSHDTVGKSYEDLTGEGVPDYLVFEKPQLRFLPRPEYPRSARRRGHEGGTIVKVLVDTDGDVIDLDIFKSSGYMELDQAAIKVAWRAKFTPAIFNGQPVRVWVSIPIKFVLTGK